MKVLSGAYIPDEGEILIDGETVHMTNPLDARRLGIEMVYQDLALANNLDVTANVFLGREAVSIELGDFGVMDSRRMEVEAQRLLDRLKINIPSVRLLVERLSGGQRQAVAIARATAFDSKVIIMDEQPSPGPGARAQGPGRFDHHHQPSPGRYLQRERPHDGPAPGAQGPRLSC